MRERKSCNPATGTVADAFAALPGEAAHVLLHVRERIFALSTANPTIGRVTETLKWGQPSYLTEQTKSGSTLRLNVTKNGNKPAIFVHCQSGLAEEIRALYGDTLAVPDNRHVILPTSLERHGAMLDHIITLILTHHARKLARASRPSRPTSQTL